MDSKYQDTSQPNKRDGSCFWIKEQKERAEIKRKSKEFREAVDIEKETILKHMSEEKAQRKAKRDSDITSLESALASGDADQIKLALKGFKL